jgi:hypothetical protein
VLSTGFLASYCSAGIGAFLQVSALLSIGSRFEQVLRQRRRKTTHTTPTLSAIQAANQSTVHVLLSMHNYTPLVISRNDKNKQPTVLSPSKLALTARNTLYVSKSLEHPSNLKNGPFLYLVLKLTLHVIKSQIHLVRQALKVGYPKNFIICK